MPVSTWAVPGYTELRPLGSGGFGTVVLATHDGTGTPVAIKYLRPGEPGEPDVTLMFRAEAAVLGSLDDPYVVRLYEYVESPDGAAIVMELVDGVTLRDILARQGKTTPEAALVVLYGSLLGLAGAHARGVVHRDYKPANVLVNSSGASKLTDFGIAARAGTRGIPAASRNYAPAEQYDGGPATPASDVYAATATFYECLAGHPPFTGQTDQALLDQHRSAPVPLEAVPEPLRPLVARGMAKNPAFRPADAAALAAELRTAAAGAYGQDWETRGRTHLGEAALLLALLWPSAGTPALTGTTVEQVQLSQVLREAGRRLSSPETRTRPLSRETTRHLARHVLTRAERQRLHLWHVLHLDHLAHEKYLRRLRNAALIATGAAVVAAGITIAATSGSHASASSAAPGAAGTIGHPAVAAYPVSLTNGAAAAPAAAAAPIAGAPPRCTVGYGGTSGTVALPPSAASVALSYEQQLEPCTGYLIPVTCSGPVSDLNTLDFTCSMSARDAQAVNGAAQEQAGYFHPTNLIAVFVSNGRWIMYEHIEEG